VVLISESRGDSNRCTPCRGKSDQHAFHARFTYGPEPYISRGPRRQHFASLHKDETCPYTREKSWWPEIDWPITPACDRYVQYLLTGPTHRSFTDTGGGYSLEGIGFPHTTLQPSQPMVLPFPPEGPARSPV
jgi:hypothetical protein